MQILRPVHGKFGLMQRRTLISADSVHRWLEICCMTYRDGDEMNGSLIPRVLFGITLGRSHYFSTTLIHTCTSSIPCKFAALDKTTSLPLPIAALANKGLPLD